MRYRAYRKSALVTTASQLEGWEIVEHLGLVSVHRVAGTGIVSDIFAGFSDFFGGRSESYGKQLSGLYVEATELLQDRAEMLGGNAVIGLRIDFDEISGQGKSMFMLNAVGTAVFAQRQQAPRIRDEERDTRRISADDMAVLLRKNQLLADIGGNTLRLDEETWNFATEHAITGFGPYALGAFRDLSKSPIEGPARDIITKRVFSYFAALSPDDAKRLLYANLTISEGQDAGALRKACEQLVTGLELVDYEELARRLPQAGRPAQKSLLTVLRAHPASYSMDDIPRLEALKVQVEEIFPHLWSRTSVKSLFGGGKEAWACGCGNSVRLGDTHCGNCGLDAWGFAQGQYHRNTAVLEIEERLKSLREYFVPSEAPDTTLHA
ncbi:MAG TPA: YbjQ family protein [Longimicrobium sp.]|jgi:uncharacterized protein YbjQ (UPF0145 family)|uniref:YbjQ family protein n=1 Tax=Longimicrobium sp. TaxID=2029185 RepID=UPI002ED99AB1